MLYLGEGAREIALDDGRLLQVFPDFNDPAQFYYLPNFPHVARMQDGTPAIRLLVYREDLDEIEEGEEEAVAFLSLDVDLSWPAEVIDDAASRLRMEDGLDRPPRLAPIFFREGSVKLMLLDAATPDEDAARPGEEAEPTEFVTSILGGGSPSLYGDNRAIFQATLPKKGAAALSGALDGVTPIGVVYSLTFAGLQPAFNVRAHVEWQKVYDHFSESENLNLLFYEKEIQKSIDTLIEERAIEFEVTVEGIGAAAMDSDRQAVEEQVRQLIFDKFFEATFERETAAGDSTGDNVAGALRTIAQDGITMGIGYTYKRKEVKVEELRTLDVDWTARRAAERTIYPQAHMHNLISESGVDRDQLITVVDGADGVWKSLPFEISAAAAWEADGIVAIGVDVEYEDADSGDVREWSVHLDPEEPSVVKRDWMDRTSGNSFRYEYEVVFQDEAVPGPSSKVDSGGWIEHEGTVLVLHPRELYSVRQLEVTTIPDFPFDRWPAVQAVVRWRADDGSFEHQEDALLTAAEPSLTTRFRVDHDMRGQREVRLTYVGASGERKETGWLPMPQDQWVVEDPHPEELTVRAVAAGDRSNIANLIVDLEYTDPDNGIHESGTLMFDPENIARPQSWVVNLADPRRRRYRYRMTLVTADGDFMQTGWISTDAPTLPVGELYVKLLTVEVATPPELAPGFEAVDVELVYDDPDNGVHEEESFRLGPESSGEWQVRLADASRRSYQWTATWIAEDGFDRRFGPTTSSETYLVLPAAPPEGG